MSTKNATLSKNAVQAKRRNTIVTVAVMSLLTVASFFSLNKLSPTLNSYGQANEVINLAGGGNNQPGGG